MFVTFVAEMTEILQVKDCIFYIHWWPCFLTCFFSQYCGRADRSRNRKRELGTLRLLISITLVNTYKI